MKPVEAKLAGQDASEKMKANADVDETEDTISQKGLTSPSLVGLAVLVRSLNFISLAEEANTEKVKAEEVETI